MAYRDIEYIESGEKKAFLSLMHQFNISQREAQRWIAYGRLRGISNSGKAITGRQIVTVFFPEPKGLKAIFDTPEFAIFNKPKGIPVHPINRIDYSLTDEIRHLYGNGANVVHRLDQDTTGAIIVSKNRYSDSVLKMLFQNREVSKSYEAVVWGKLDKEIVVDNRLIEIKEPRKNRNGFQNITAVDNSGKDALTTIKPIYFDGKKTVVEAFPQTGRRHQIRVHLDSIGFPIVGDPIYGSSDSIRELYFSKKLNEDSRKELLGCSRLLLHSKRLSFKFQENHYDFKVDSDFNQLKF